MKLVGPVAKDFQHPTSSGPGQIPGTHHMGIDGCDIGSNGCDGPRRILLY